MQGVGFEKLEFRPSTLFENNKKIHICMWACSFIELLSLMIEHLVLIKRGLRDYGSDFQFFEHVLIDQGQMANIFRIQQKKSYILAEDQIWSKLSHKLSCRNSP